MSEPKFFKSKSGETLSFSIVEPIGGGEEQMLVFIETPNSKDKELAMFFSTEEFIEMAADIINQAAGAEITVKKQNYSLN